VAHNVTGTDDPRLGEIHLVLLSHVHGDHIGDQKLKALGAGTCANSGRVPAGPNSMTAEVAAANTAALVMTRSISGLIGAKIQNIRGGKPITFCPQTDGATNLPVGAVCRSSTDLGGTFMAKTPNASHSNNMPLILLSEAQRATLSADGAGLEFGPPTGFVIKFTNGLSAYLSATPASTPR
jgi:hypothetical protein